MDSDTQPSHRIRSVDALRGLVMIIMALDHVRDFFHVGAMSFQPEDLTRTTALIFFTRWITHFCAPVFMFTAGLSAYFWLHRPGRTKGQLSSFLVKRGLWLVFLELTAVRFAFNFSFGSGLLILTVLWALGWCMVFLAGLIYLPTRVLAAISIATVGFHNLLDRVPASQFGSLAWMWNILHQLGVFPVAGVSVLAAYTLVPWFAVMSAGYCFGPIMSLEPTQRRRTIMRIGLALTLAFFVIRGINVYGDPQPWSSQIPGTTILSFLRCTKYPPSLDFLLMTLGPALVMLALLDRTKLSAENPLIVFGRVPLFYFIVHLYISHVLAFPLAYLVYGKAGFLFRPAPSMGGSAQLYPAGYGYNLGVVYVLWILVVVLLYPLCRWFAQLKARRRDLWITSYL